MDVKLSFRFQNLLTIQTNKLKDGSAYGFLEVVTWLKCWILMLSFLEKKTNWIQVPEPHHHIINWMKSLANTSVESPALDRLHVLSVSFNNQQYLEFGSRATIYKYM